MTIETTLLEQAYVKEESPYGTLATPGSTDAFRHIELGLKAKNNREPSQTKMGTPDRLSSLPRGVTAEWDLGSAYWEPSGTLGTPSYMSPFLKNGIGAVHTTNLATTVAAMPAPTTTSATLVSVTGLAVGDTMVFTVGAGARREVTRIKTLVASAVTFDALSAAPDAPGAAVSGVSYNLATLVPTSLSIFKFHTAGGFKEAVKGAIVDKLEFMFDGAKEVGLKMSGPAATKTRSGFSQPGAFTVVGSPASGLVGNLYIDGTAFLILSSTVTVENNNDLRRNELGNLGIATGIIHHKDFRNITVSVTFYLEDTNLITKGEASTLASLRLLVGNVNGKMIGAVMPSVEFEIPEIPTSGGPKIVTAQGIVYQAGLGNDGLFLGEI